MESHGTATACTPGHVAEIGSRLIRAIPKAVAFSDLDPKDVIRLTERSEPLERALALALRMLQNADAPDWDKPPYNPKGWRIIAHVHNGSWRWDPGKVEAWHYIAEHHNPTVETVVDAAGTLPKLNARVAEFLWLHEYPVPDDWVGKYVAFPGTVFENDAGECMILAIYCNPKGTRTMFTLKFSESWHSNWIVAIFKEEEE